MKIMGVPKRKNGCAYGGSYVAVSFIPLEIEAAEKTTGRTYGLGRRPFSWSSGEGIESVVSRNRLALLLLVCPSEFGTNVVAEA